MALPAISGLSGVSAGVGTPAGPTGTATTSTTTSTTGTTTPTTGTTTSTTGTTTTTTGVHAATTGSTAAVAPAANAPLSCASPTIYNVTLFGNFYALDFETLRNTLAAPPDVGGGSLNVNAMGITADGLTVYTADMTPSGGNTTVHVENVAAGTNADFARQPASNVNTLIAGGVNPTNGFYYYGGWNSAGDEFFLFAFNPSTDSVSAVGTITPPAGVRYTNGDLTFDAAGNMTLLAGSSSNSAKLLTISAPVPTVGPGSRVLPFTVLATINSLVPENYSGIAFAADSSLYVETVQKELLKINPNTGGITDLGALTGINGTPTDLASCTFNGSLAVQKNIVGRVAPTDQFTMTITGGGVTSGNSGTTSGSSTGVQTTPGSVAGPIVGIPGTIYRVAETAASGSLSNYSTTWSCLNGSSPFSSGTGTSFNVVFPSPITRSAGASLVCTFTNRPASIGVTKTPSPTTVTAAGQTITYSYAVTNTGPLPLTGVTVADAQTPPAGTLTSGPTCVNLTNPPGACFGSTVPTLAAGQVAHFTATYTVSQADMNHGSVADSATATGNAPSGTQVSAIATASVMAAASPSISIVKAAFPNVLTRSGETITYTFLVTNTGNVTLNNVNVTDHPAPPAGALTTGPTCQDLSNPAGTCSGNSTTLVPGQRASFIGTYAVTQADFDHGSVVDNATAAGTPPSGPPVTDLSNTVTVSDIQSPGIAITKAASPATVTAAGQRVIYTFVVTNTGNVTLTGVGVTDVPTAPAGGVSPTCQSLSSPAGSCSGPTTTLAPGQLATFTGNYVVTQVDLDHGSVVDHATTHGTTPSSGPVDATSNTVTVTAAQSPTLSIAKSANPTMVTAAGEHVAYTFSVTNTGNVTVTGAGVTDVPVSPAGGVTATCVVLTSPAGTCSGATTPLVPGQTAVFTGTYAVTQGDINHGSIQDTGVASGTSPSNTPVTATSSQVTVTVTQLPSLTIAKTATPTTVTAAGEPINYTFTVVNTGNLTLTSVGVSDIPTAPGAASRRPVRTSSIRPAPARARPPRSCRARPPSSPGPTR